MTSVPVVPVVLCGGSGTRLWPLSRAERPKQFLSLAGEGSLLEQTLRRCSGFEAPVLVGATDQRELLSELITRPCTLLCEPSGRNTAAAACVSALHLAEATPGALALIVPSDHHIGDPGRFVQAVNRGISPALQGRIVVFGIAPTEPATGYGYIEAGRRHDAWAEVVRFVEKPDRSTAEAYVARGLLWNAGMFLFQPSALIAAFETLAPDVLAHARAALRDARRRGAQILLEEGAWASAPSVPLDTAIMERTDRAAVVDVSMQWADLGSFSALWERGHGRDENALVGDAVQIGSRGCYVHGEGVLVAVKDVEDLVVVGTPDAVLVTPRHRTDAIKPLVEALHGRSETVAHPIGQRPWGHFRVLDRGVGFQVKRLHVEPRQCLSLQRHAHREEHWTVVAGEAHVQIGDAAFSASRGERIHVPAGEWHRLENRGDTPLVVVEVQLGDYLGEDDIERREDVYGRS